MRKHRIRHRAPAPARPRLVVPLAAWPEIDRRLWQAGLDPGDGLDDPAYAAGLQPATITNARKGYGRLLAVLAAADDLDPTVMPAERVTRARATDYLKALRAAGNDVDTIIARFMELRMALRLLQPETYARFGWLTESLKARLPKSRRQPIEAIDSAVLADWGEQDMDDAPALTTPRTRSLGLRNGLLVAILTAFAPRQRSLAAMRLGRQVTCHGEGYRIALEPADVKNRKRLEYDVPPHLVPYVRRYLAEARVVLLGGRQHDWFWVNQNGARLDEKGIAGIIRRASQIRFGKSIGAHRFRHGFASTAARLLPGNPGLAAGALGVSEAVVAEYYDKASTAAAAAVFQASLEEDRRQTEALARRAFGRGP
jgi:site-specific recombinase XerD